MSGRSDQGDILNDHLSADPIEIRQGSRRQRPAALPDPGKDILPPFLSRHSFFHLRDFLVVSVPGIVLL